MKLIHKLLCTLAVLAFTITADAQVYRVEGFINNTGVTLNMDLDSNINGGLLCAVIVSDNGVKKTIEYGVATVFGDTNIKVTFDDGSVLNWYNTGSNTYKVTLGEYTVHCTLSEV